MDVRVIQKPVSVICECDKCGHEEEIDYTDFTIEYDDPPEWEYNIWECPECGYHNEITGQDWD